jgi:penicillin-binding protein 1C
VLNKIKHIFLLLVGLALLFLILDKIYPLDTNRIFKPKSTVIYDKNNQVIRVHLSEDGFLRMPIENKNITNDIKDVLLSYEDKYFYEHFGVNPISIKSIIV